MKLKMEIFSKHNLIIDKKLIDLKRKVTNFLDKEENSNIIDIIEKLQDQYKQKYINNVRFLEPKSNKFLKEHSMKEE
jgi:hypothetical protein